MYFLFSFCNICGHIISPEFFCGCNGNNKRCIICKCREHPQMSCYEALCVVTSSGHFDVCLICNCGLNVSITTYQTGFICECMRIYCIVCGKNSSFSHEVCSFLLKFGLDL